MSLADLLREPPPPVRALLHASGISREVLDALLDDLAVTLRAPGIPLRAAPTGHAARERAAAIAAVGETLSELALRGTIAATAAEMRAVHAWVRVRLLACVDERATEYPPPPMRDAAIRNVLATAGILFIEFDPELRVRWTPDFDRPPFDRASVGRRAEEFLGPEDGGQLTATLRRVLATGAPERAEVTIRPNVPLVTPDEGPLEFLVAVEPMRDGAGAIVGVLCASTNVTELKRMQAALREALGMRDLMMAVLAHDLRNPLSTVRALSSTFARNEALPEKVRLGLVQIESASRRMDELIGTLLDFSAARAGGSIPVVRAPADAHAVALGVVDELRQSMPSRQITIASLGDTTASLDAPRIAQVISNLVGNALAHGAPAQPVDVTIDGNGADLLLAVHNEGIAIAPSLLPVLFEPFRRGDGLASRPRGLGLGLYITREIVRAHQGTIEVVSTDHGGTVFTVRLPRVVAG
jgi:signal transduction histidine kinase